MACADVKGICIRGGLVWVVVQVLADCVRVCAAFDDHHSGLNQASIDYIIKLVEAGENVESYIGMPADLRTAATQN